MTTSIDLDLEEGNKLRSAATSGPVVLERRFDEDGSIDYILYSGADVAACFEIANRNARANAAYLAWLYNNAEALIQAADERDYWRSRTRALEAERRSILLQHGMDLGERPELDRTPINVKGRGTK